MHPMIISEGTKHPVQDSQNSAIWRASKLGNRTGTLDSVSDAESHLLPSPVAHKVPPTLALSSNCVICAKSRFAVTRITNIRVPTRLNSYLQIPPQRILPGRHNDAVLLQASQRQHGILRAFGGADKLLARSRTHDRLESRTRNDLAGKLKPGTLTTVGGVHNPLGSRTAELHDRAGQVRCVSRRSALVVNHVKFRPGCGQFQNCVGKTFATNAE